MSQTVSNQNFVSRIKNTAGDISDYFHRKHIFSWVGTFAAVSALVTFMLALSNARDQKIYQAWQLLNSVGDGRGTGGRSIALKDLYAAGVELRGIKIAGASLESAEFPQIDLSSSFLTGARLDRTNLSRSFLRRVSAVGISAVGGCFLGADLSDSDFSNSDFRWADLREADFSGSNLSGANFSYANLDGAILRGADMSSSTVLGATINKAVLVNANLEGVDWRALKSMRNSLLRGARNTPKGFREWSASEENDWSFNVSEDEWKNKNRIYVFSFYESCIGKSR